MAVADAVEAALEREQRRGHRSLVAGVVGRGAPVVHAVGPPSESPGEHILFEIGSLTKPFTGALLADLHLDGVLSLSDPVASYLEGRALPDWDGRSPTLEQLATHATGLPNVPRGLGRAELLYSAGLRREDPWASVTPAAYEAAVGATRARQPRRGMRYSSLGFGLLGAALAGAGGSPYAELLRERLCAPLGMHDTHVEVPETARERRLTGHSRRGRVRPPLEDLMPAAGSLRSTGADMARWLAACVAPGEERPGPALRLAADPRRTVSRRVAVGLGWLVVRRRKGPPLVWHNGGTWGFRSFAGFVPEEGVGAFVLSNTARSVDRLGLRILELAAGPGG